MIKIQQLVMLGIFMGRGKNIIVNSERSHFFLCVCVYGGISRVKFSLGARATKLF